MSHFVYHRDFSEGVVGKYAAVARRLRSASTILEVGCHTGYFTHYLEDAGHSVVGIDNDADAIAMARQSAVDVHVADISDQDTYQRFPGPFDAIIVMDVLEHLAEPEKVLQQLRNVLKPDGTLIVTGPNVAFWAIRAYLLLGRWEYTETGILDRTHLRFYNAKGWRTLIEKAGFVITDWESVEGMVPKEQWLTPLLGKARVKALRDRLQRQLPTLMGMVLLFEATKGCVDSQSPLLGVDG